MLIQLSQNVGDYLYDVFVAKFDLSVHGWRGRSRQGG